MIHQPVLSLFACEKYALVDEPGPFQTAAQYELLERYGKDYLFRNTLSLPLGLTFDSYLTEDSFLKLSPPEKATALLRAAVLANEKEAEKQGLTPVQRFNLREDTKDRSLPEVVAARRKTALQMTSFSQTRFAGHVSLNQRSILVLQMPFDRGWRAFQDGRPVPILKVDVGLLGVGLDPGKHEVELRYRNRFLVPGLLLTLASVFVLGAGWWRWPRLTYAVKRRDSFA